MEAVNIRVGRLEFDHADYDADGDVLYLQAKKPRNATPSAFASGTQRIVGLTVIDARQAWTAADGSS